MIFLRFNKDLAACGYVYNVLLLSGTTRAWMSHWPHRPGAKESKAHTGALQAPTSHKVTKCFPNLSSGLHLPGKPRMFSFPANIPPEPVLTSKIQEISPTPGWLFTQNQIVPFKMKELLSSALNYAACFPGWAGTANEATMQRKLLNCARKQRLGGGETAALWKTQTLKHFLVK